MAITHIDGVKIAGISACVPTTVKKNIDNTIFNSPNEALKFIEITGVAERRISDPQTCTSDLTIIAAKKLINELEWEKSDIGILLCITQTPDFHGPMNSSIIQDRLGLTKDCISLDIPVGCSGFVYGSAVISSMMKSFNISKGILLVGDTLSKQASPKDKSTEPLFGDAGSAIAFSQTLNIKDKITFDLGGDGSGYKSLYMKDGGYRYPFNQDSLNYYTTDDGLIRNSCHTIMEGMDVFSFGISTVPKTINNLLNYCNLTVNDIDYFVFHQANYFLNETIRKRLKISPEKVPYSIAKYGNTSSATIPLTMLSEIRSDLEKKKMKLVLCGFGIGLSWGTMLVETENILCLDIIEI